MELPCRAKHDRLLPAGELSDIRRRLRSVSSEHPLRSVIACAFDHRTRMLPFLLADTHMVPGGVRSVAAALLDSGFDRTRVVLRQWNKRFDPARMRLEGQMPDLFLISSMSLHTADCVRMLRSVRRIPRQRRPLTVVGGSLGIYEPWLAYGTDPHDTFGPDAVVTGETYVLLNLLEVLLSGRNGDEPLRRTFRRARDEGALQAVPGLVYPLGDDNDAPAAELVDTGIQRLCKNLDEQADPTPGYGVLEPPGRSAELAERPLPADRVRKLSPLGSLVMTLGCKFACPYCPIPAYNQRVYRTKSGERIAREIRGLYETYGIRVYFGADDNFFNDHERTLKICETLAGEQVAGKPLRKRARLATEVTVHDTLKMAPHLPLVRLAGFRALWLGVEDLSGKLIRKGQDADKTTKAFALLRSYGIAPNPMLMHHDEQQLYTTSDASGLLNQVRLLDKAGAATVQVLMMTPSAGSKLFEPTYRSGVVISSAAGRPVTPRMYDGNYVIATKREDAWRRQWNLLAAYALFYNPLRIFRVLARPGRKLVMDVGAAIWGAVGLWWNIAHTVGWSVRLALGPVRRMRRPPQSALPVRSPDGGQSSHALTLLPAPPETARRAAEPQPASP
ncbi:MAG: B12-binding domain-containing radical SAM protein [Planctomycetota bacterium]